MISYYTFYIYIRSWKMQEQSDVIEALNVIPTVANAQAKVDELKRLLDEALK